MNIAIIFVLTAATGYFTSWWTITVVPFAVAFCRSKSAGRAFVHGFTAIALLWLLLPLFFYLSSSGVLVERIGEMLSIPWPLVFVITALLGGIVGGLAALSGFYGRQVWRKENVA